MENLGLVGFTGAGANRLFSALTGIPVPSEYEAAVGVATVPDERVDRLAVMSKSKNVVHAGFELVHLALPPGAMFIDYEKLCCEYLISVIRSRTSSNPDERMF